VHLYQGPSKVILHLKKFRKFIRHTFVLLEKKTIITATSPWETIYDQPDYSAKGRGLLIPH